MSQAASAEAGRAVRWLEAHAAIGADGSDGVTATAGADTGARAGIIVGAAGRSGDGGSTCRRRRLSDVVRQT